MDEFLFSSNGTLVYSEMPYKLILKVDDEIGKYYRALIPKWIAIQKPLYSSHISTIRKESPPNLISWGKYQDQIVTFQYDPYIYNDELYYWLNAFSPVLEEIRLELGLPTTSQYTRSPDGRHRFHLTVANTKHLR